MREIRKDIRIFTGVKFEDKLKFNKSSNFSFSKGKRYTVSYISDCTFIIKDDNNCYLRVADDDLSFISVADLRDEQLNKLL